MTAREDHMPDHNVDWETCTDDRCIGVRLPTGSKCWAHAADTELDPAFKRLGVDGHLDARGVPITQELLRRLLAAAPQDDQGHAILTDARFEEATFRGFAKFDRTTFQGAARFDGVVFQDEAFFNEATFQHDAGFLVVTFQRGAGFGEATFQEGAEFGGASFQGFTGFGGAAFQGRTAFVGATFCSATARLVMAAALPLVI
jgi:Pentapeptide repeats (9 copies)